MTRFAPSLFIGVCVCARVCGRVCVCSGADILSVDMRHLANYWAIKWWEIKASVWREQHPTRVSTDWSACATTWRSCSRLSDWGMTTVVMRFNLSSLKLCNSVTPSPPAVLSELVRRAAGTKKILLKNAPWFLCERRNSRKDGSVLTLDGYEGSSLSREQLWGDEI